MIELIEDKRNAIEALCRKYCVARLEVFGSAADGSFNPDTSDLDFLVEFLRVETMNVADQYFGLLEGLGMLFARRVDLVCASAMRNPYFIKAVSASRKPLYAA